MPLDHTGLSGPVRLVASFRGARTGNIAMLSALLIPIVFLIVGGTLDYGFLIKQRLILQAAADSAAIAAAKELSLIDYTKKDATAVTTAMVNDAISAESASTSTSGAVTVSTTTSTDPLRITVVATQQIRTFFNPMGLLPRTLDVRSVAQVNGKPNVCVLALDPSAKDTLYLEKQARLTGQNCAVYSNSTHSNGLQAKNSASITATMICSAGGKVGGPANFSPDPITDCPYFEDPLASRPAPAIGTCTTTNLSISNQVKTLDPGTYCGGITIAGNANVTLTTGVYVIKDGPLIVRDSATLTGEFVGFYLTGNGATFHFETATTIDLTAPKDGALAGLLMYEGHAQTASVHEIFSDNARRLLGTVYLPKSELKIDANKPVADQSAYTAIVARQMTLYSGPNLVLNTNYDDTPVPVPAGIRGVGQPIALVQ